jgi:hypothetical protein
VTGNCAQHQRALAQAIKTARELVLLPYTQRTVTERPGGRRGDRERPLSDTPPPPPPVSVEVTEETDGPDDAETELPESAEVEDVAADEATAAAGGGDGA